MSPDVFLNALYHFTVHRHSSSIERRGRRTSDEIIPEHVSPVYEPLFGRRDLAGRQITIFDSQRVPADRRDCYRWRDVFIIFFFRTFLIVTTTFPRIGTVVLEKGKMCFSAISTIREFTVVLKISFVRSSQSYISYTYTDDERPCAVYTRTRPFFEWDYNRVEVYTGQIIRLSVPGHACPLVDDGAETSRLEESSPDSTFSGALERLGRVSRGRGGVFRREDESLIPGLLLL